MRRALLLLAALLAAGCVDPYDREPDETQTAEQGLEPDSFYLPRFDTPKPARVRAHVEVLDGGPVDAFLAYGAECSVYPYEEFQPAAKLLATTNGSVEIDIPAGSACLVLDNNPHPLGESAGTETVRVRYRLDVWHARAR